MINSEINVTCHVHTLQSQCYVSTYPFY